MYVDTGTESPSGPVRMVVAPEKLLQLKHGLEDERDRIGEWLKNNRDSLRNIDPPGNDPCSKDTMFWMSQNGQEAVDACNAYLDRLTIIIDNLHDSAATYGLIEDNNANHFHQGTA